MGVDGQAARLVKEAGLVAPDAKLEHGVPRHRAHVHDAETYKQVPGRMAIYFFKTYVYEHIIETLSHVLYEYTKQQYL